MKLENEQLKEIIKQEINNLLKEIEEVPEPETEEPPPEEEEGDFGKGSITKSDAAQNLAQKRKNMSQNQQGITNVERAVIQDFLKTLELAAQVSNIKTGNIFSLLNRVNKIIKQAIEKEAKNSPQ